MKRREKLRNILVKYFNESELRDLCFQLEIDHETLGGEGHTDKARELVTYCERRGRLPDLWAACRKARPNAPWNTRGQTEKPIRTLRRATKLLAGPVALALTGASWPALGQRLLTQASRLPHPAVLNMSALDGSWDELDRLTRETQAFLTAYQLVRKPGQVQDELRQRAGQLARLLMQMYCLGPGQAPELDKLAVPASR